MPTTPDGDEYSAEEMARLFTHHAGHAAALEAAAQDARKTAGRLFSESRDDAARIWHDVGIWLDARAVECRKTQAKFRG